MRFDDERADYSQFLVCELCSPWFEGAGERNLEQRRGPTPRALAR